MVCIISNSFFFYCEHNINATTLNITYLYITLTISELYFHFQLTLHLNEQKIEKRVIYHLSLSTHHAKNKLNIKKRKTTPKKKKKKRSAKKLSFSLLKRFTL